MEFTFRSNKLDTNYIEVSSHNLYEVINEALSNMENVNGSIYVFLNSSGGKKIICDILSLDKTFTIKSKSSGIIYDITNVFALRELKNYYQNNNSQLFGEYQNNDKFYEMVILSKISNKNVNNVNNINQIWQQPYQSCPPQQPLQQQQSLKQPMNSKKESISSLEKELRESIETINNLNNVFKTYDESVIGEIKFRDEIEEQNKPSWKNDFDEFPKEDSYKYVNDSSSDDSEYDGENSDSCEESNNTGTDTIISTDTDTDTDTDTNNSTNSDGVKNLEEQLKLFENIKSSTDEIIKNNSKRIENEKENLSKYHCLIKEQEFDLKREHDKLEQEYNKFISEKDYTYGLIYEKFFIKNQIKGWDCVPPFFMIKFPIFVYLDGRDTEGNVVRPRILDTKDDFKMYKLMYDALVYPDFEMPEDEEVAKIILDFLDTYPSIPIQTETDIMCDLNTFDKKNTKIFEEDETSMCSNDEKDDDVSDK